MSLFDRLEKLFMAVAFAEGGDKRTAQFWVKHRGTAGKQKRWQATDNSRKRPQIRM
ncbi:hypothetical protein [Halodesulfovibrio marinisediminis]|uniref:Uncharacterized protein n=1 Tax=Halodesulfovibrio marinisediminis DSM 17456 TaxID=1121457 RepID=A0A1N6DXC6_9BACT|nr:hypothetical protein [Halodesulfovibrio marinisediminis]SIN75383.1 hypothetical protein SAMN02745161_0550 [Halodesulfovibrio marinisediminis DSM 17456]